MAQSKVRSYIGFCIKARKITLGANAIGTLSSGVYLLILDKNAAKNSLRFALKYKRKFDCPLILCNEKLEDVVCKKECKLAAIRDRNLADRKSVV